MRKSSQRAWRSLRPWALPLYAAAATVLLYMQTFSGAARWGSHRQYVVPPAAEGSLSFSRAAAATDTTSSATTLPPISSASPFETMMTAGELPKHAAFRQWSTSMDALPVLDGLPANSVNASALPWGRYGRKVEKEGEILVVLVAYKRCKLLEAQIRSVKASRVGPEAFVQLAAAGYAMPAPEKLFSYSISRIILLQNGNHCSPADALAAHPDVMYMNSSSWNTKFYGRFLPSLISDEQFTLLLDDDIVLEERALANLLRAMALNDNHAIVSGFGKVIKIAPNPRPGFTGSDDILGANMGSCNDARKADSVVDYITNVYFFPTLFARTLFATGAWQYTWDNGEDITLGSIARRFLGAPAISAVSRTPECLVNYGVDEHATSSTANHFFIRKEIMAYWYARGWRGVCPGGPDYDLEEFRTRCIAASSGTSSPSPSYGAKPPPPPFKGEAGDPAAMRAAAAHAEIGGVPPTLTLVLSDGTLYPCPSPSSSSADACITSAVRDLEQDAATMRVQLGDAAAETAGTDGTPRERLLAALSVVRELRARTGEASCATSSALGPTGGYCLKEKDPYVKGNWYFDDALAKHVCSASSSLREKLRISSVLDVGAGVGQYGTPLKACGLEWRGFDAAENVVAATKGRVAWADFAVPLYLGAADIVFSLGMSGHIPAGSMGVYLDNLARHARVAIMLTWKPTKGEPADWMTAQMANRGFDLNSDVTAEVRAAAEKQWYKGELLVFVRRSGTSAGVAGGFCIGKAGGAPDGPCGGA